MNDLISRQDAIEAVYEALRTPLPCYGNNLLQDSMTLAKAIVNNIPSTEPEQKIGKWIEWQASNGIDCGIECSECGYKPDAYPGYGSAYCPTCGAKMEK